MRMILAVALAVAVGGTSAQAQQAAPNAVQMLKADGLEVTFLNFGWNPEAFAAMETGGSHAAAGRSWVIARLSPNQVFQWQGKTIPAYCGCLLVLNPAAKGEPMTLDVRRVDLGNVFANLNVIATPPEGVVLHKAPAGFSKATTTAARLEMDLKAAGNKLVLSVHYGDRQAAIELTH